MKHHVCRPSQFLGSSLASHCPYLGTQCCSAVADAPAGLSGHSIGLGSTLTPADDDEDPQVVLVGEEGHEDQAVQVETFHQDPVVVGGQKIEEESHHHLAANLWKCSQSSARTGLSPEGKSQWLLLSGQQNPGCAPCMVHVSPLARSCSRVHPGDQSYICPGISQHQN